MSFKEFWNTIFPGDKRYIAHLEEEIVRLRDANQFLTNKVERMELSLMPFTSAPGAAYAASTAAAKRLPDSLVAEPPSQKRMLGGWSQIQMEHLAKLEKESREAALEAATKGN